MKFRGALAADRDAILGLLPRLADFEIPARRRPEELWRGDERLLEAWFAGADADGFAHVAETGSGEVAGVVYVRLGPELLSGEPGAHLEVLAVAPEAEGQGVASELVRIALAEAKSRGARTMSLNVFAANERARRLYERLGFDGELIRYIRELG